MTDSDGAKPLTKLLDAGDIVMVMTMIGDRHTTRPLTVAAVDGDRLSFLTDATADWYGPIAAGSAVVHLTLCDVRHNVYASLNGMASVSRDRSEIERLWSVPASAYFDGKDDPNLAVLRFDVSEGEYWDAPSGRLGSLIAMVKAAVGGSQAAGEQGRVATN